MSHSTGPPSWFTRCDQDLTAIARFSAVLVRQIAGVSDPPPRYHNVRERSRRRRRRRHRRLTMIYDDLQEESESCRAAAVAPLPSALVI